MTIVFNMLQQIRQLRTDCDRVGLSPALYGLGICEKTFSHSKMVPPLDPAASRHKPNVSELASLGLSLSAILTLQAIWISNDTPPERAIAHLAPLRLFFDFLLVQGACSGEPTSAN